jgi:hypothetical protein
VYLGNEWGEGYTVLMFGNILELTYEIGMWEMKMGNVLYSFKINISIPVEISVSD